MTPLGMACSCCFHKQSHQMPFSKWIIECARDKELSSFQTPVAAPQFHQISGRTLPCCTLISAQDLNCKRSWNFVMELQYRKQAFSIPFASYGHNVTTQIKKKLFSVSPRANRFHIGCLVLFVLSTKNWEVTKIWYKEKGRNFILKMVSQTGTSGVFASD